MPYLKIDQGSYLLIYLIHWSLIHYLIEQIADIDNYTYLEQLYFFLNLISTLKNWQLSSIIKLTLKWFRINLNLVNFKYQKFS